MSECAYCGAQVAHRPYARKRDGVPSVSSVAELLDDGKARSFAWTAAGIAATTAVHSPELWEGLGRDGCTHDKHGFCPACRFLRSEFDRQWTAKANLGTHVHHVVEDLINGLDVDQDETVAPYLDAFERFWAECEPEWLLTEATVLYDRTPSHRYRGQTDGACAALTFPGTGERAVTQVDWKTGNYYPVSQALQLSAYAHANWVTDWSTGEEVKAAPTPKVEKGAVVLLRPDGNYQLIELPIFGNTHGTFLRLVDVYQWLHRDIKPWVKEHPLVDPAKDLQEVFAA